MEAVTGRLVEFIGGGRSRSLAGMDFRSWLRGPRLGRIEGLSVEERFRAVCPNRRGSLPAQLHRASYRSGRNTVPAMPA